MKLRLNSKLPLLIYLILGATIFSLNSLSDLNPFWRSNLVFWEIGLGFMLIYFAFRKITKNRKINHD
jgi:hypothetical protein